MVNKITQFTPNIAPKQEGSNKEKTTSGTSDFLKTLNNFMSEVNELQKESGESVKKLASGEITNIHDVMVAMEKANVSFELMMEIRNKVLEAYREIMRVQV